VASGQAACRGLAGSARDNAPFPRPSQRPMAAFIGRGASRHRVLTQHTSVARCPPARRLTALPGPHGTICGQNGTKRESNRAAIVPRGATVSWRSWATGSRLSCAPRRRDAAGPLEQRAGPVTYQAAEIERAHDQPQRLRAERAHWIKAQQGRTMREGGDPIRSGSICEERADPCPGTPCTNGGADLGTILKREAP
jgi:hypothetical protein